jgi:ABC-type lipoprotein release transport system permease subunit
MTAVSPSADRTLGPVPADLKDDEILVNRWLADAIGVGPGDALTVGYSELTPSQDFAARTRSFRVRAVVEMEALEAERDLFPEFPGLTDVDSCRDWDIGITLEENKLKDPANEEYWKKHKETPKALVTLAAGRSMWANRYGDLMAVRFPGTDAAGVAAELRSRLKAEDAGLVFRAVRAPAERAVSESMDLGRLFLGMSFFLIVASLLLTAMLFVFTVEQRAREMGVLRAVGFRPAGVRRLFLGEGAVLAVAGSLLGVPVGLAFARALVWGLGTAWSGAVADAAISFHATALSGLTGAAAAAAISLLAMAVTIRRQARRPVRELVAEDLSVSSVPTAKGWTALAGVSLSGAAVLALAGGGSPGAFFGAGALMLVGGIALIRIRLGRQAGGLSVAGLGVRNASRRPGRGAATAAMLASGCFIVFSVSAFQEDLSRLGSERRSGTGGFEIYGESSIALHQDLNGEKGRAAFRLAESGVSFVPLRVREGDDASCLNLNQAVAPTILGVDPEKLEALGAFAEPALWKLLEADGDAVPALVGDAATAVWKLKRKVGDVLDYRDERGEAFRVRLAGALPTRLSVLQGRILIANRHFTRLFPSEGGHRVFLIDAPAGSEERVIAHLSERLEAAGFEAVRSTDRLREFYAVESAYLRMFLVLGGLGLLLGTAGMAVLVLRNILERRSELALLRAVGFAPREAVRVVLAEHRFLLVAGLIAGTAASAVAVGPAAFQPSIRIPWLLLAGFLAGTAAFALGWIAAAARAALRIPLVPALRHEA